VNQSIATHISLPAQVPQIPGIPIVVVQLPHRCNVFVGHDVPEPSLSVEQA